MRTAAAFRSLGAIDVRNVARDAMLRWIAVFTPAFGLFFGSQSRQSVMPWSGNSGSTWSPTIRF